eukprot:14982478-Heterocapsa_arctica.AAC.1
MAPVTPADLARERAPLSPTQAMDADRGEDQGPAPEQVNYLGAEGELCIGPRQQPNADGQYFDKDGDLCTAAFAAAQGPL